MSLSFHVSDWSFWTPESENVDQQGPNVKDLPMMLRRRLSKLGKMAMRVAHDINLESSVPLVFSSRYGESAQTVKLLHSLAQEEPLSPAGFSMSVHNGLAGLLSIASKNTQPHTAVSAGKASFCNALLEATAQLQSSEAKGVLLVHYDEPLPEFYAPFGDETVKPQSLALYLKKGGDTSYTLSLSNRPAPASEEDAAQSFSSFMDGESASWAWSDGRTSWIVEHGA